MTAARLVPALALLAIACPRSTPHGADPGAAATPATDKAGFALTTEGAPSRLRFEGGALVFCDRRGPMKLDLGSGRVSPGGGAPCPALPAEPNTGCADVPLVMDVRAPPSEPSGTMTVENAVCRLCAWSKGLWRTRRCFPRSALRIP